MNGHTYPFTTQVLTYYHTHSVFAFDIRGRERPKWTHRYPRDEPHPYSTTRRQDFYNYAFTQNTNRLPYLRPPTPKGRPHSSLFLHLYNWNYVGDYRINVPRDDLGERIIRLASRPTDHVAALQEARSPQIGRRCHQQRISDYINLDGRLNLHVGHTGIQVIVPLYTLDRNRNRQRPANAVRWTDIITCPPTDDINNVFDHAIRFSVVDIGWLHPELRIMLERGGKTIWRVMNFCRTPHTESEFSPQTLRIVLGRLLMICLRDKIDVATGYQGDAAMELLYVLDDLSSRMLDLPKIYVVRN